MHYTVKISHMFAISINVVYPYAFFFWVEVDEVHWFQQSRSMCQPVPFNLSQQIIPSILFICLHSSPHPLLPHTHHHPAVFWGMQFQREWKGNVLPDSISIELNWIKWESIIRRHCLSLGVIRALFKRWCLNHHICPTVSAQ